jgi:diguanylate cyclase
MSLTDALTGLGNRRAFENQMEVRMVARQTFSLIMIDLNGFKAINDQHGHMAGDDLLRQFGGELRAHFNSQDLLARWGGDEFAAIVAGPHTGAECRADRIRRWALGDYKISTGNATVLVAIDAALGVVEWNGSETQGELIARTDRCLYADKNAERRQVDRRSQGLRGVPSELKTTRS